MSLFLSAWRWKVAMDRSWDLHLCLCIQLKNNAFSSTDVEIIIIHKWIVILIVYRLGQLTWHVGLIPETEIWLKKISKGTHMEASDHCSVCLSYFNSFLRALGAWMLKNDVFWVSLICRFNFWHQIWVLRLVYTSFTPLNVHWNQNHLAHPYLEGAGDIFFFYN